MGRQTANTSREPNKFVRKAAQAYNEKYGFRKISEGLYVVVDVSRARRIADAYEALPIDDSGNPAVRKAYRQLAEEIEQQWNFAIDAMGMTFDPWRCAGQPYGTNSAEMCGDVRNHRHLYFFQGGDPHPLLGKADSATGLSLNDMFRAIHDLFGHAAEGYGFGPRGEENAWIKHSQMFSAEAYVLLPGGTVARDHGPNATRESGETNHRNVNQKEENDETGQEKMNGAGGLLAAENGHDGGNNRNDSRRHGKPCPDNQGKQNEDNAQVGEPLKHVIG